jgi:hypothetical protein
MRFDAKRRVYINERGRVVTPRAVRKEVEDYIEKAERAAEREAAKLLAGTITTSAFFKYMKDKIEAWHKVAGTIAYGGRAQMDDDRWARLESIITREREYLDRFHDELRLASEIPEGIVNRAGLYPNAAYATYENQVREREADAGVTLGRRICAEDEASCEECVAAATEEFIPLSEIPDIGSLTCISNCRCEIEFDVEGIQFATSDVFAGVIGGQEQYGGSVEIQ